MLSTAHSVFSRLGSRLPRLSFAPRSLCSGWPPCARVACRLDEAQEAGADHDEQEHTDRDRPDGVASLLRLRRLRHLATLAHVLVVLLSLVALCRGELVLRELERLSARELRSHVGAATPSNAAPPSAHGAAATSAVRQRRAHERSARATLSSLSQARSRTVYRGETVMLRTCGCSERRACRSSRAARRAAAVRSIPSNEKQFRARGGAGATTSAARGRGRGGGGAAAVAVREVL